MIQSVGMGDSKLLQGSNLTAGVVWDSIPLKVVQGDRLIDPLDHNMPFEMIPPKLKVDTKHRLLMLIHAMLMNIFRTLPWTSDVYILTGPSWSSDHRFKIITFKHL